VAPMAAGSGAPAWLERLAVQGASVASAAALADAAGVEISVKTHDEEWVADCVTLEHQLFPRHEAMDIPHEIQHTHSVTLLCASLKAQPGTSVSSGSSCAGYALLQRFDPSSAGSSNNAFAALRPRSCLLTKLAVAPGLQRRGIGKALLAAAVGHARIARASTCTLHVDEDNARARALYASFGFVQRGERLVDFYRTGRHALELVLDLEAADASAPAEASRYYDQQQRPSDPAVVQLGSSPAESQQEALRGESGGCEPYELVEELE
jgi:ribosomal protein S18 acetylase RimI-like enzyme